MPGFLNISKIVFLSSINVLLAININEMISGFYQDISYHSVITTNATDISRSSKHIAHLLRLCHFAFLLTKCYEYSRDCCNFHLFN